MRSTIHVVSPRDYWPFAAGIGPSRREWWLRTWGRHERAANLDFVARKLELALTGRTWHRKEIDALLPRRAGRPGRARRSRSSAYRRRDVGPATGRPLPSRVGVDRPGRRHGGDRLTRARRYLTGFGPAGLADAADWAGVPRARLEPAVERLRLRAFEDESGKPLLDLPRIPLPDEDTPAPPRFLGTSGRRPARARAPRGRAAGALPPARLLDEDAAVGRHVPRRRRCRRELARRADEARRDAPARAVRAASPRRAGRAPRRGRAARPLPRARREVLRSSLRGIARPSARAARRSLASQVTTTGWASASKHRRRQMDRSPCHASRDGPRRARRAVRSSRPRRVP